MVQVDRLIAELAAEGEVDSKGGFTLDRAKAREKMRRFQLADPHRWVLLVVESLVARGATRVDVYIDADDVIVAGDARPLTREIAENPWGAMFAEGEIDPGTRELALALNAVASLGPRWARLESGDGERLYVVEIKPKGGDTVDADETFSERPDAWKGIRVHFKRTLGRVLSNFLWGDAVAQHEQPERRLVTSGTVFSSVPVALNGEIVSHGWGFAHSVEIATVPTAPPQPRLGVDVQGKRGVVYLVSHGVTLDTKQVETGPGKYPPGFFALVDASALDKDVSHARIVEDVRWDEAMHRVRSFEPHLDLAIATWASTAGHRITRRLVEYLRVQVAYYADNPSLVAASRPAAEAFALLSRLRLWETVDHEWVSVEDVLAAPRLCGVVSKVPRWNRLPRADEFDPASGQPPPHVHVPARPPEDIGWLFLAATTSPEATQLRAALGEKGRNVDPLVDQALRREVAIDAWRSRPLAPTLGEGAWRGRASLDPAALGEGIRGEVGLRDASDSPSSIALTRGGHVLFALELRGIDGVAGVVDAPFETTPDWGAPVADATFVAVMAALGRAIAEAATQGHADPSHDVTDPDRERFTQLCVAATDTRLATPRASLRLEGPLGDALAPAILAVQRGLMLGLGMPSLTPDEGDLEAWYARPIATARWILTNAGFTSLARWRKAAQQAGRQELRIVSTHEMRDVPPAWTDVIVADEPLRAFIVLALRGFTPVDISADLRAQAEREAFLRKPIRAITALGNFEGARFPARFEDAATGLTGEIALDDPRESALRIACLSGDGAVPGMGRVLGHEKTLLALPGWVAAVAGPGVRPMPGFAGVERESLRAIRRVVRRAVAARVVEFAGALARGQDLGIPEQTLRPIVVAAIRHLRSLANGEEGIRDLLAHWREQEATLLAAPIVRTCRGGHLTLHQLEVAAASHELVFAGSEKEAEGEPDPVLLLDERMMELVTTCVPRDRLVPLGTLRARRRLDAKLASAPTVARVDLADEDVLIRVPLQGLPGELGIPKLHPRSAVETRVIVTSRKRILCEIRPEFEVPIRAIVDAGVVDYDATRDKLPHGAWKRIVGELRKSLGDLFTELARHAPQLAREDRRLAGTWLLAEIARRAPGCAGKPDAVRDGLTRALLDAPVFQDGHGLWRPLRAFATSSALVLRPVYAPPIEVGDAPVDPLVFVEASGEREWLHRIFPAIEEELDRAHRLRGISARLGDLPAGRAPPADAVIQRALRPKGEVRLSGTFWLPARLADVRGVECLYERRVVGTLELDLPCDGAIEIEAHAVPAEAGTLRLASGEIHRVRKSVHGLWKDLVERAEKADKARREIREAPLLADMCVFLAAARAEHPDREDDRRERLFERLAKLHVFSLPDGQLISYLKAMASYPRVVQAWRRDAPAQQADAAPSPRVEGPSLDTIATPGDPPSVDAPVAVHAADIDADTSRADAMDAELRELDALNARLVERSDARGGSPSPGVPEATPQPAPSPAAPPPPHPDAVWLDTIRRWIRRHQPANAPLVESLAADTVVLRALDGRHLARVVDGALILDRTHPVVQAALLDGDGPGRDGPGRDGPGRDGPGRDGPGRDGPGGDGSGGDRPTDASRVALWMVVSAAYTAINAWAVSVTDAHELEFHESLLRGSLGPRER
jgi:hypothetical protein